MQELTDEQPQAKTAELKDRLKKKLWSRSFRKLSRLIREADRRVLGMEPFPVQLMGGIIMSQGRVAEMCTGEEKPWYVPSLLSSCPGRERCPCSYRQ
ncbi:MAG: hypothetical protein ACLTX3_08190 [Lachnospiraceae bacterium]